MTAPAEPLDFPRQPTTLDEAKTYLGWVADHALRGRIGKDAALGATKAMDSWMRAENYAKQIRDLQKQVKDLLKATKA